MSPKRVFWIAAIAAVLYIAFAYWVITNPNFDLPPIKGAALAIVFGAAVCQIAAKWFFGLLFKDSIQEIGSDVRAWSAFKAALVGAGVARLIPAGGAITPVAMSWTVRDEVPVNTAGPAIRTVLLNYAGLLMMAGGALLLERPQGAIPVFQTSLLVIAPFVVIIGVGLMFGSGKLGSVVRFIPEFIRKKVETSMVNHHPGWESQLYIWARLALEAAAFWLVMQAFGIEVNVLQAIATYAASQLVGGLPGMPGGLGVTEGSMALILAAYGFPASTTLAPIIVYRIVSYWLPAALSFLAGGSTFLRSEEAKAVAEAE
ncbi:MAG TPA: flippase-like domain-containing protein [Acidimicrobiia bacterium]|nr:flippase-like domain-containing protein [Acidimicrobiia bacterium]